MRSTYYQVMQEGEYKNRVVIIKDYNHPDGMLLWDGTKDFHIKVATNDPDADIEVLTTEEVLKLINEGVVM